MRTNLKKIEDIKFVEFKNLQNPVSREKNVAMRYNIKKGEVIITCQCCLRKQPRIYLFAGLNYCKTCLLFRMRSFNVWKIINDIRTLRGSVC